MLQCCSSLNSSTSENCGEFWFTSTSHCSFVSFQLDERLAFQDSESLGPTLCLWQTSKADGQRPPQSRRSAETCCAFFGGVLECVCFLFLLGHVLQ